jgi:hypothetical protein
VLLVVAQSKRCHEGALVMVETGVLKQLIYLLLVLLVLLVLLPLLLAVVMHGRCEDVIAACSMIGSNITISSNRCILLSPWAACCCRTWSASSAYTAACCLVDVPAAACRTGGAACAVCCLQDLLAAACRTDR